ncbi:hypothetical protein JCM17846_09390 [Iodidimonas nitroreducens]|uniref:Uncharacterized protein n=1 Tax=Iodidimonas nitroreducens TaxID=1236968 RepID=A0A5A7N5I8_9PROT|nr:patatin-like phospholipase family protein [Iodidimonas nitroreducens]GER03257.1 hypothetical protein JCM17846_09390 [Iodidimonas nitroreducens]
MRQTISDLLTIRAGRHAHAAILADGGLDPARIKLMVGASGGPKWLVLARLDRAILRHWILGRSEPLDLLASSIGTWRFACYAQKDPLAAFSRFEQAYLEYRYEPHHKANDITRDSYAILDEILGPDGREQVFHGPMRLAVMAVRGRHLLNFDHPIPLGLGLAAAAAGNLISRRALGGFFERALFADPRSTLDYADWGGFPFRRFDLNADNLRQAIMASCSIPMVLNGIGDIPGAMGGLYRDGGIIDYHFDLPFFPNDPNKPDNREKPDNRDKIVLYPHFIDRIIPGWFDKPLRWRKARATHAANVLLIAPSPAFVARLPYGKIPDRKDFRALSTEDRLAAWRTVLAETERLSDALDEMIETGTLPDHIRPIEERA